MLPATHRLRTPSQFAAVVRGPGARRHGSRLLVVHTLCPPDRGDAPSRVGFVVSTSVGNAVVRNRVKRRLRQLCSARLERLGTGVDVVVRATPAAATASSGDLGAALDRAWDRLAPSGCPQ